MAEISAAAVMKLRKMSGQGMMDCKKALGETNGDLDAAMELLRKKGLATMEKRAGRETTEGRVICKKSADGKTAVIVSLCCETDFVSKNDDFVAAAEKLAECAFKAGADEGADAVMATEIDGRPFADLVTEVVSKTGEKTEVGDYFRYTTNGSVVGTYVHFNNKIGALVEVEVDSAATAAAVAQIADEIAMHVTAINPAGVDESSISADVIEKERQIATEQMQGKPAQIIDKIVDGKMKKFFQESCLVYQTFVKDDTKTVAEALQAAAKTAGGTAKVKRFSRVEIG